MTSYVGSAVSSAIQTAKQVTGIENNFLLGATPGLAIAGASIAGRTIVAGLGLGAKGAALVANRAGKEDWKVSLNQSGDNLINFAKKNISRDLKVAAAVTVAGIAPAAISSAVGYLGPLSQNILRKLAKILS